MLTEQGVNYEIFQKLFVSRTVLMQVFWPNVILLDVSNFFVHANSKCSYKNKEFAEVGRNNCSDVRKMIKNSLFGLFFYI